MVMNKRNKQFFCSYNICGDYMKFNSLIPELSVTDIEISKSFYLKLGFIVRYERKEDKFCFLELENNQIMIEQINDKWYVGQLEYPFGRGINISMQISNIDKFYDELINNNVKIYRKLQIDKYRVNDKIYEDKEFLIQDPDGYLLRFNN